jgi:hypothetical protein
VGLRKHKWCKRKHNSAIRLSIDPYISPRQQVIKEGSAKAVIPLERKERRRIERKRERKKLSKEKQD